MKGSSAEAVWCACVRSNHPLSLSCVKRWWQSCPFLQDGTTSQRRENTSYFFKSLISGAELSLQIFFSESIQLFIESIKMLVFHHEKPIVTRERTVEIPLRTCPHMAGVAAEPDNSKGQA